MLDLKRHADGTVLPIHAHAGARANAVRGVQDGALKVAVTQIAEKGKANKAIVQLLSKKLKLSKACMELLSGATHSHKRFLIRGVTPTELKQRIGRLLD